MLAAAGWNVMFDDIVMDDEMMGFGQRRFVGLADPSFGNDHKIGNGAA